MTKETYTIYATRLNGKEDRISLNESIETFCTSNLSQWIIGIRSTNPRPKEIPPEMAHLVNSSRIKLKEEADQYPSLNRIEINYEYDTSPLKILDFDEALKKQEQKERKSIYGRIIKLVEHIK